MADEKEAARLHWLADPMEFETVVRARRMTRSFDPERTIDRATVQSLVNLAIRAPSAGHTQGWEFLVLDDITSRAAFWDATADDPNDAWLTRMRTAPVLIVCFADREAYLDRYAEPDKGWADRSPARWPVPYWDVDTGMAAMILLLAAQDRGLGACFIGVPGERWAALRQAFDVPERLRPVGVVLLGHAVPGPRSPSLKRGRRAGDQVTSWGRWGTRYSPDSPVSCAPSRSAS